MAGKRKQKKTEVKRRRTRSSSAKQAALKNLITATRKIGVLRNLFRGLGLDLMEVIEAGTAPSTIKELIRPIPSGSPWSEHKRMLDIYSRYVKEAVTLRESIASEIEKRGGVDGLKIDEWETQPKSIHAISIADLDKTTIILQGIRVALTAAFAPVALAIRMRLNLAEEGFERLTEREEDWEFLADVIGEERGKCRFCLYRKALAYAERTRVQQRIGNSQRPPSALCNSCAAKAASADSSIAAEREADGGGLPKVKINHGLNDSKITVREVVYSVDREAAEVYEFVVEAKGMPVGLTSRFGPHPKRKIDKLPEALRNQLVSSRKGYTWHP